MTEKILKIGCGYHKSLHKDKLDDFAQDLIELCKKHGVIIKGAYDISPSRHPDYSWDVRGLVIEPLVEK